MKTFQSQTVAEQVAAHLREEMKEGRLSGIMPGVLRLEAELAVNRKTVDAALRILERDGLLLPQGAGKRRLIAARKLGKARSGLRVGFLLFERTDWGLDYMMSLDHVLANAGHTAIRAPVTLTQLGKDVGKLARLVGETKADAWVVVAASQEVLKWFIGEGIPVMAMFGRGRGLPLASVGPGKIPAYLDAIRRLIGLGHRRIVWLTRRMRRLPKPGEAEQAFLNEMAAHGFPPGAYNLPDWEETVSGFLSCLESLFRLTPPTALVVDEAPFYFAAHHFLASRGLAVPGDVSLVCTDGDPNFAWCQPTVAHIRWDHDPLVRRVAKWVENVSRGKPDQRHTFIKAEFVPGGTIGPART